MVDLEDSVSFRIDLIWDEVINYITEDGSILRIISMTNHGMEVLGKAEKFCIYFYITSPETGEYTLRGDIGYGKDNDTRTDMIKVFKILKNQKEVVDIMDKMIISATVINVSRDILYVIINREYNLNKER